jgi:hypothetical protein
MALSNFRLANQTFPQKLMTFMAPMSHSNLINPESHYCYPDHDNLQFLILLHIASLFLWYKKSPHISARTLPKEKIL